MPTTLVPIIGNGWWQSDCDLRQGDSVPAFYSKKDFGLDFQETLILHQGRAH